jgi:hypothetical protein
MTGSGGSAAIIAEAVIIALTLLGLGLILFRKLDGLNSEMKNISDSIGNVENNIQSVNLEDMEKALWRVAWEEDSPPTTGNSVKYELNESGVGVTISLASEMPPDHIKRNLGEFMKKDLSPEKIISMMGEDEEHHLFDLIESINMNDDFVDDLIENTSISKEEVIEHDKTTISDDAYIGFDIELGNADIIVVNFEFDEKVNTRSIVKHMNIDDELADKERDLFGYEGHFSSSSPYELNYAIASDNFEKIGDLISIMVSRIDKYNKIHEKSVIEFDKSVSDALDSAEIK